MPLVALLSAFLTLGCASGSAPAGSARSSARPLAVPTVTLQAQERQVKELLELLASSSGQEIRLTDEISGTLGVSFKTVPWDQALEALVLAAGLHASRQGDAVLVSSAPQPGRVPFVAARDRAPEPPPRDFRPNEPQQRIAIDVEDMDLADVMEQIGAQVGVQIRVDPSTRETVTLSLNSIPWREAVEVIAEMTRCEVVPEPEGLLVAQPAELTFWFEDAEVLTVLLLVAAYCGHDIVVTDDVRSTVSVRLYFDFLGVGVTPLFEAIGAIAETAGLSAELNHGIVVVSKKRFGWGQPIALPSAPLPGKLRGTPLAHLRARGAKAADWFRLLALYIGRQTVIASDPAGVIAASFDHATPLAALRSTAQASQWRVLERGHYLLIGPGSPGSSDRPGEAKPSRANLAEQTLTLSGGRRVQVEVQALAVASPNDAHQKSSVIIGGTIYFEHDLLLAPGTRPEDERQEVPLEVLQISADELRLKDSETDRVVVIPLPR